jgi:S-layer protein
VSTTSTLTAGIDKVAGGAGDDIINAGLTSAGQQTLTALDSLKGGDGTDTIAIVMKANATPASDSVEVYTITATAASVLSMLGSTGVTSVTNTGSSATLTVSNVALGTTLTLGNTAQGGTFNYLASDITGTADAATINISSVTGGAVTVGAGIEALTLNSSGTANTLGSLSSGATTLNITGDQNMTITGNATATTIDASAATGKVTVTSDNTKAVSITTGSGIDAVTMTGTNALTDTVSLGAGNDKVTFGGNLADADIVDGGDGTDTLVGVSANIAALTSALTTSNMTNFEVVQISDQSGGDFDVSDVQEDGITTVTLAHSGAALVGGAREITGEAGSLTVNLGKSAAANNSTLGATLTVNDGVDNVTVTDTVTINNTQINTTDGKNTNITNNITSTGYENVVLNTGAGSGNTEQTMATLTVTADAATAATTLTLKGGNAIDLTTGVVTNSTSGITIDASAMSAQASGTTTFDVDGVTTGATGTVTITGSGGDDLIGDTTANVLSASASTVNSGAGKDTIFTGAGNDTIDGGAGKDTINSGSGNDTVVGGSGNDAIDFSGNFTIKDSVDGGDGTDTLTINNTDATTLGAFSLGQVNTMNGRISNIEVVSFGTTLAQSIDMGRVDNIGSVILGNLAGASGLTGLAATNNVQILATTGQTLTLGLADDTGTADVVNIQLTSDALIAANTVTAANIETVNINGADPAAGGTSDINTITLTANKATSVKVTGNDGLTITATGSTKVTDFDASAVAAISSTDTAANMAVTYTSLNTSATTAVTIKGGAGNDTLQGNAGHDTITGAAGADIITYTGGNDTLSGGTGGDTFQFTKTLLAANSVASNTTTVDGGSGTDIVKVTDAAMTIVDADFDGFTSVETFTSAAGANSLTVGANAKASGLSTYNGGAAVDTVVLSDVDYDIGMTVNVNTAQTIDVLTGGTFGATGTADVVALDVSALETATTTGLDRGTAAVDLVVLNNNASVADTDDVVIQNVSADNAVSAAGANIFILVGVTAANVGAAVDLMEASGTRSIAHTATIAANDAFIFVYSDGTDGFVTGATFINADTNGSSLVLANNDLEGDKLIKLTGIDAITATTFSANDFDFIA